MPYAESSCMQLKAQGLQHDMLSSVGAFNDWLGPVREIKAQAKVLKDAVKSLGREACPQLKASAKNVYQLSSNLKAGLKAIFRTYDEDLKCIRKGKPPYSLFDREQELGTFKDHVRFAESLVAAVLDPTDAPDCQGHAVDGSEKHHPLALAYGDANLRVAPSEKVAKIADAYRKTVGATKTLHTSIQSSAVRSRVSPFSEDPDYLVTQANQRAQRYPSYVADHW
ncbi:MAG TPA: hypothetical protein VGE55_04425 [Limnobacter sp.]|uniref:hypothetical protein n=1 Tax=Limnobacter sp. TaxID=2003368 RepID=UPI002EDACEBC